MKTPRGAGVSEREAHFGLGERPPRDQQGLREEAGESFEPSRRQVHLAIDVYRWQSDVEANAPNPATGA